MKLDHCQALWHSQSALTSLTLGRAIAGGYQEAQRAKGGYEPEMLISTPKYSGSALVYRDPLRRPPTDVHHASCRFSYVARLRGIGRADSSTQ